jgi:ribonuclease P protein component
LEKIISVCENKDFRRIYGRGKTVVKPQIVLYYLKSGKPVTRIGVTTSKKIGNAVMRNRSRRIIKAAVRELYPKINKGYDLIIVARGRTPYLKSTEICSVLSGILKDAHLVKTEETEHKRIVKNEKDFSVYNKIL